LKRRGLSGEKNERKTTSAKNTEWSGRSATNRDLVGGKIRDSCQRDLACFH
jgi:hypothetical protein